MKELLEKDIQKQICEWLTLHKYFFWRQNNMPIFSRNNAGRMAFRSMGKYTLRGIPDIVVIVSGQFIGIEVKRNGTIKLTEEQTNFGVRTLLNGGLYYKIYSLELLLTKKPFCDLTM